MSKGPPIPVRFEVSEAAAIDDVAVRSGLSAADIIRRAVRLFYREVQKRGIGAVIEETAVPLGGLSELAQKLGESAEKLKSVKDKAAKKQAARRKHAA